MEMGFIHTKASINRKNAELQFKATAFQAYKPKQKTKVEAEDNADSVEDKPQQNLKLPFSKFKKGPELNMKLAKREIIKFGMSGFDAATQEEAKVQLAIKLGAKPKKNKNINYKQLLETKKREKLKKQEEDKFQQLGKNNAGRSTAKGKTFDKKRKLKSDILDIYGSVKHKDLQSVKEHKHSGKIKRKS